MIEQQKRDNFGSVAHLSLSKAIDAETKRCGSADSRRGSPENAVHRTPESSDSEMQ